MASTTVAPPAAAPAAAAPSTPAPVSTPSTPAVSTPTPTPTPGPLDGPGAAVEAKLGDAWKAAKAAVPLEETTEAPAETTQPSAETIMAPDETQPAVTETPQTDEEKAAAAAKAAETATTEEAIPELVLDDETPANPADLAKELGADPAAKKFFDDRPELKNKVMAALRRDGENREIRQLIPDVETAKTVTQAAATFQQIDNRFLQATTPEGATEFLNHWVREAMIVDDKGQPVLDGNGKYQLHPALTYTFDHIFKNKLSVLAETAKTSGNERLQAALDIINEATSPSSSALGEFPDELKPHADALKTERAAFDKEKADVARQQRESQQAAHHQSIERAESKAADTVKAQLKSVFAKAGLTEFEQSAALREIGEAIDQKLTDNSLYQSIYDSILQDPPGEAREKRLMKHMLTYTNEILGGVAAKVIRDAKGGAVTRQADKQAKVAAQTATSKTEPQGVSVTSSATSPVATTNAAIIAEYEKTHNGEKPSTEYVLGEALKRARGGR